MSLCSNAVIEVLNIACEYKPYATILDIKVSKMSIDIEA
jgi:hypothetical protein